jgi:membrane-bound serine protease (ClpP class)
MWLGSLIGAVAVLCLYFEFFLPGGILALFAVVLAFIGAWLFFAGVQELWICAVYLVALVGCAALVSGLALRQIRRSKDSFCLHADQEGFSTGLLGKELLGKQGIVSSELKPAGHVRIEGQLYQAVSQGHFIGPDEEVEVVSVRGSHLVVKAKK